MVCRDWSSLPYNITHIYTPCLTYIIGRSNCGIRWRGLWLRSEPHGRAKLQPETIARTADFCWGWRQNYQWKQNHFANRRVGTDVQHMLMKLFYVYCRYFDFVLFSLNDAWSAVVNSTCLSHPPLETTERLGISKIALGSPRSRCIDGATICLHKKIWSFSQNEEIPNTYTQDFIRFPAYITVWLISVIRSSKSARM